MNSTVYNTLISQKDTALGTSLNVVNNAQWLTTLMYSTQSVSLLLPVISSITTSSAVTPEIDELETSINTNRDAIDMLTNVEMEESYFLAQSTLDKLAIAAYALYLNGRK